MCASGTKYRLIGGRIRFPVGREAFGPTQRVLTHPGRSCSLVEASRIKAENAVYGDQFDGGD